MNIILDQDLNAAVTFGAENVMEMRAVSINAGGYYMEGSGGNPSDGSTGGSGAAPAFLSNWLYVGGISGAVLLVSIILGIVLGRKRIKKGIDLYES